MRIFIKNIAIVLTAVLFAVSCNNMEAEQWLENSSIQEGNNVLEATLEGKTDNSRTTMSKLTNGVYKTYWSQSDKVGVFINGVGNASMYQLIAGEGTTQAAFKGYGIGESYIGLYPFEMCDRLKENMLTINLPSEQTYAENSYGPNSFPMIAKSNTSSLEFKNLCAVLRISMIGHQNVKSIVFAANDPHTYVSGKASIDVNNALTPTLEMQDGSVEVTLNCNGLGLNPEKETDFHIVLPAQVYKGGFTLTINTSTGKMYKTIKSDVTLERSQIRKLKTFVCKLDEGIETSTALNGKGTEESPFLINGLGDLLLMQGAVNSEDGFIKPSDGSEPVVANAAHYKLMQDISLSEICGGQKGDWIPIGNYAENENYIFKGVFDGDGHTIRELYINNKLNYQALFGRTNAIIKNLTVKGSVKANALVALIVASGVQRIENCQSYGKVEASVEYGAGICNDAYQIIQCVNYADISGESSMTGGITGSCSNYIISCINNGNVTSRNTYIGGIVGYQNSGDIYNCQNNGKINGYAYVGGISGYSRQGSSIFNCCNTSEVTGEEIYIGGISGLFKRDGTWDDYSRTVADKSMMNCVNTGVVNSNVPNTGSIVGLNDATINHCYWLYDADKNLGMKVGIGNNVREADRNYGLSEAQMKDEQNYHTVLYTSNDGCTSYYKIMGALNAWAYDNKDYCRQAIPFYAWKQGENGYPELDNKEAFEPEGETDPLFELSQKEFSVSSHETEISIIVAANMEYYISSKPDWVTEKASGKSRAVTETTHMFIVQENLEAEGRQGVIVFCNEAQQCIPVIIVQKGKVSDDMAWTEREFWHKSLAMRFTADWCGYCPIMAESFAEAQKKKPGKIEVVHMHCSGNLVFEAGRPLWEHYNISGYPTGIVDSRYEVRNYQPDINSGYIVKVVEETEKKYGTQSGISFDSYLSDNQISVDLKLYLKKADKYKVTVLLLEGNIVGYQNGKGNDYIHNDVIRMTLTDIKGNEFSTDEDNTIREFSYKGTIPSICNKDNLRVLVYVERAYGSQQVISSGDYGDYYVDNALSEKVGVEAVLKLVE